GGIAVNVVPDAAQLCVSVRPPPGRDVDAVRAELFALATAMFPRVGLTAPVANPSFAARAPPELAQLVGGVAAVDLGFWTEAALWSAAGIDCVVWGPGGIAQA